MIVSSTLNLPPIFSNASVVCNTFEDADLRRRAGDSGEQALLDAHRFGISCSSAAATR